MALGRPKGSARGNDKGKPKGAIGPYRKKQLIIARELLERDITPLDIMKCRMLEQPHPILGTIPSDAQFAAACALAPYLHPRLSAIAVQTALPNITAINVHFLRTLAGMDPAASLVESETAPEPAPQRPPQPPAEPEAEARRPIPMPTEDTEPVPVRSRRPKQLPGSWPHLIKPVR